VSVASATTAPELAAALAALPPGTAAGTRAGLDALCHALTTVTRMRFVSGDGAPDAAALAEAIEVGRAEVSRLSRERFWRGVRRAATPARWRAWISRP
jgi:hypothetical protein